MSASAFFAWKANAKSIHSGQTSKKESSVDLKDIKAIIDLNFDRDDPHLTKTKAFVDKVDEIWELVRGEAIKAQTGKVK